VQITRRTAIGTLAATGLLATTPWPAASAEEATPAAASIATPGVAIARVRKLPTPELNDAIYPDVMRNFLPVTAVVPGFLGYIYAFHATDPAAAITLTLLADDTAATAADAVARQYVGGLDPRFTVETPVAARGPVRMFAAISAPASALPPFLHGCVITMRNRTNAPGADMEAVIARASRGLVPLLEAMPGFILYCWIETEGGRTAINIWETADQLQAGNEAIAAWVADNTADSTVGEPVVNDGIIGYATGPGLPA
jgi:hypothetical protein